jgi:hypothetical protein
MELERTPAKQYDTVRKLSTAGLPLYCFFSTCTPVSSKLEVSVSMMTTTQARKI